MNKVVFIDYGLFLHRAIFGWESELKRLRKQNKKENPIPAHWHCANGILATLKMLGLHPDDTVIIAVDGRGNWRKDVDSAYKANRKDMRDSHVDIDWNHWFKKSDELLENLQIATPFKVIKIEKLEADDIISAGIRYFKDRECIIVSTDSDFEQLTAFDNVKLFSPQRKAFKTDVGNPFELLEKKIEREKTDNLITPIANKMDYERRKKIVSLISLPEEIEEQVVFALDQVMNNEREYDLSKIIFPSLIERYINIFNNDKVVTVESTKEKKRKQGKKKKVQKVLKKLAKLKPEPIF